MSDQARQTQSQVSEGGDSETDSGGTKTANNVREASCAENEKWITSFAGIVAPQTCDLAQGRDRC
jgi:hypothetical protein